jgi:alanine racemase
VLIKDQQAPLVGNVSMDMITIDVTDIPGVDIGTPVCLWGKDLSVNKIAKLAGTISYEIFTRMGQRLPFVYV